jgi:hypothetical protein
MARATWLLAATSVAGIATSAWLYVDNRELRAHREPHAEPASAPKVAADAPDPWTAATRSKPSRVTPLPALPEQKEETRGERRNRHQQEFAAMFGRTDGESAEQWKARVGLMIKTGLALPRSQLEDQRKAAEAQAHVTPEQSKQLDHALDKVYGDVIDYTNKAVVDGELSPYERNVAGWLDYAGGLGGMLTDAQGQIGQILSPDQQKAMSDSGFEWDEYLGASVPWEQLAAPPPPKPQP